MSHDLCAALVWYSWPESSPDGRYGVSHKAHTRPCCKGASSHHVELELGRQPAARAGRRNAASQMRLVDQLKEVCAGYMVDREQAEHASRTQAATKLEIEHSAPIRRQANEPRNYFGIKPRSPTAPRFGFQPEAWLLLPFSRLNDSTCSRSANRHRRTTRTSALRALHSQHAVLCGCPPPSRLFSVVRR
jgi:hypothetical protein